MKKAIGFISIVILFFTGLNAFAEEAIDENALFGNDNIVSTNKITDNAISSNADKESFSITGRVRNDTSYTLSRKFITNWSTNAESNPFNTTMLGNLLVDIRLRQGIKAFANVEVGYYPFGQLVPHYYQQLTPPYTNTNSLLLVDTNNTTLVLKEFFIDANFNKAVFLRAGKQVLQWGTAYFWNPSDLINIQRKSFSDMSAFREGSSGLKVTIPFGTVFNIYGYLDVTKITNIMDTGVAGKLEFLLGATEISLSAWAKRGYYPVYAMDFTSRLFGIDFRGEASLSYGDNNTKLGYYVTNIGFGDMNYNFTYQDFEKWDPRVSFGFSKTFDFLDVSDRIGITAEVFWNANGSYDPNLLKDDTRRAIIMNPFSGIYQPNYLSAYYMALFTSYAQFFNPDLSFSFNMIMNMVDWSSVMTGSFSWSPVYNLTVALNLSGYFGDANTEYTVSGGALGFGLTTSLSF
jgi:hypothetical protein